MYHLLDNGTVTHRVDDRQPIAYGIELLKYQGPHLEQDSETTQEYKIYL